MTVKEGGYSDAAAFIYIRTCLVGRAHRFRKKMSIRAHREPVSLNEPVNQNGDSIEKLNLIAASDSYYDPNRITELITLQNAMKCLTPNELKVINAVYFQDEKIVRLSEMLQVSKNTILKTKRTAQKTSYRSAKLNQHVRRSKNEGPN